MAARLLWAALWTLIVTVSVFHYLLSIGWLVDEALVPALLPYLLGTFIGGLFGHMIATHLEHGRTAPARFAAFFAANAVMTLGFVALFFFLHQRIYFAQWHADAFSVQWLFQLFFTGLGSAYLFLATGLRPLLPWAVVALAIASILFSRGRFPTSR